MNKISICTVCMNRLHHLHQTLPVNIAKNEHYPDIEFVLLDYNSKDGLEDWVRSTLSRYIESGILKYYKTYEPAYFSMSHSKNLVSRLASGHIVCNVDADNYAGPDYAGWVNSFFADSEKNTVLTTIRKTYVPNTDQGGKLCYSKALLNSVKGYDESLVGYGIDDVDFVNRLEKAGGKRHFIDQPQYLEYIGHSDEERMQNLFLNNNLDSIYILTTNPEQHTKTVLYLLKNKHFYEVSFQFDAALSKSMILSFAGWVIKNNGHRKGSYEQMPDGLSLSFDDDTRLLLKSEGGKILSASVNTGKQVWEVIPRNIQFFHVLSKAYSECMNRIIYAQNDIGNNNINTSGWGKGTVYLNFDTEHPIQLS